MLTALYRIRTRVAFSNSYNDNHYNVRATIYTYNVCINGYFFTFLLYVVA